MQKISLNRHNQFSSDVEQGPEMDLKWKENKCLC